MTLPARTIRPPPEATRYDPPLDMSAGRTVDFHCDYINANPHVVVSGSSPRRRTRCAS